MVLAFPVQAAHRSQEARENRLVQLGVPGRNRVRSQLQLANGLGQLSVELLPFAHPEERQKLLAAPLAQLTARHSRRLLVETVPQVQNGHEV